MNDYEEKKQARIDRYRERADKARQESQQLSQQSITMLEHIPPGQPILVGHHSEKAHRNLLDRADRKMGQAVAAAEKADYYEQKARAAENNTAISSDDPEALTKLEKKLESLQIAQTRMKQINAYYRKHGTCQGFHGLTAEQAEKLDQRVENGIHGRKVHIHLMRCQTTIRKSAVYRCGSSSSRRPATWATRDGNLKAGR